jgi:hypothetical protein
MNDIPFPSPIAFLHLVRAASVSIDQAARLYSVCPRTVRHWCRFNPISHKIAGGSRRVSLPLAELYVTISGDEGKTRSREEKSAPQQPHGLYCNHQQRHGNSRHSERAKGIEQDFQDIGGCPHPPTNTAVVQKCRHVLN